MKITVLMGGTSAERDVSLASGLRIAEALRTRGHRVTAIDTARGPLSADEERAMLARPVVKTEPPSQEELARMTRETLPQMQRVLPSLRDADVVFLGLHGGAGEDGTIQAMLDLAGIRYTGSGHLASALAMDKDLSKQLFRANGVATADWMMAPELPGLGTRDSGLGTAGTREPGLGTRDSGLGTAGTREPGLGTRKRSGAGGGKTGDEFRDRVLSELGLPVVVKPSKQGSTVGLSVVKKGEELQAAIAEAFRYDDEVMVEQFIAGRELTVGILGGEALPVGEIIPKHEIYDYECKYQAGMAVEEFPARISREATDRVQEQARRAFAALKLRGCARIDFRMTEDGGMYCLEANTLPGMTQTSLIPQAAAAAGIDFPALCERIALLAPGAGVDAGGAR